jgi:hypothetical protein
MPTILTLSNVLRVVIFPNDHPPRHVHVIGPNGEAVFELNCPDGPVSIREYFGFRTKQLNAIATELMKVLSRLCAEWERIHETGRL